ncbi:Entner-Doudoroff aldolase [Synechococcus sp. PCC 7502]|uniref:bifunctional 4-hydroxy-2-oxoglutarate aldolase/2-dehydro-3-deoxy-phosphogluconate aldolase n=1 Tax=Synechococcus sp. PCC 7502 TaxID=1173263 RepID=UPI00029FD6EB|nr:bifunctional 4-hydroxy-2-oxoglutarate aldolase/2-dehydro-3-deoxy-phosphogluconate aldolase [Synechococcus sp. PCC 7502]AFY72637.1 Entner-Doudoroff aldolase [Synechococcus sp. PCC 7502]
MNHWISLLQQYRIFAVIRAANVSTAYKMAIAAAYGGIRLLEITWNTESVELLIPQLVAELPHCQIGTGTVLNIDMARQAIKIGCKFVFTPHVDQNLIQLANHAHIPIIAGAMTPTEILQAWQWGADAVKIFPIKTLGGQEYIKCLKPVLENIPLIPTGGVTVDNTIDFLKSGAIAVGISTDLFLPQAIHNQDWQKISDRAKLICTQVEEFNQHINQIKGLF